MYAWVILRNTNSPTSQSPHLKYIPQLETKRGCWVVVRISYGRLSGKEQETRVILMLLEVSIFSMDTDLQEIWSFTSSSYKKTPLQMEISLTNIKFLLKGNSYLVFLALPCELFLRGKKKKREQQQDEWH